MPAIATTMIGLIAGWFIAETPSPRTIVRGLLAWGLAGVLLGLFASHVAADQQESLDELICAVHRRIWRPPHSRCAYWLCDVHGSSLTVRVTEPFVAIGRNAILLFVLSGLIARTLIYLNWPDPSQSLGGWIYRSAFQPVASPYNASLLYAVANLAILYALLAYLHRRRRYLTV